MSTALSRLSLVAPLEFAEDIFLQVMLNKFSLRRMKAGGGVTLEVEFDRDTPAIWSRQAKWDVQKLIPDFEKRASHYQNEIDRFLLDGKGKSYSFNDDQFFFRYASGGTLPILRMAKEEYYCLFYRDVFPVGWNIANGSCDTMEELLNPMGAVERELREELIIVDLSRKKRYVFDWDAGKRLDMPVFAVAQRIWQERFKKLSIPKFEELEIPLKWLDGPDSVKVKYAGAPTKRVTDCYLNINGRDFGIEIDRVANISVDEDVTLLDGEITRGQLQNRVVGLFKVDKFGQGTLKKKRRFIPDKLFFNGNAYEGRQLERVIHDKYLPHVNNIRSVDDALVFEGTKDKFDLCPVTRRIIHRYSKRLEQPGTRRRETRPRRTRFDTFISFHKTDQQLARKVYNFVSKLREKPVFFSEENQDPDWGRIINEALISSKYFIAVATDPKHLTKRWPSFESKAFHMMIQNGRKPKSARMLSFISFDAKKLPLPILVYQAVVFGKRDRSAKLEELARYLP